jgi:beta-mannosidase
LCISCKYELSVQETTLNKNWVFKSIGDTSWIPAIVPGSVHTDLLENNIIENPYYRLNEHDLQWIDKKDWLYKTKFSISQLEFDKKNSYLEFYGLDTYAKVYINDSLLLISDNMFRSYKVNVKDFLKVGSNDLQILFESPINKGVEKRDKLGYYPTISANDLAEIGKVEENKKVSIYSRKAGYHFGWDWGPRLVTSGIWRPITYKNWDNFKINDVYIQQDLQKDDVVLKTSVEISFDEDYIGNEIFIEAIVSDDNDYTSKNKTKIIADKIQNTYNISVKINNPKLWWPNGMGEQHLYKIKINIYDDKSIDSHTLKTGVRTIELVREPDSIGTSFYFKVNGHPVFMKGANYIPQDAFLARPTKKHYEHILTSAKKANMNMIRVWGGGVYESDYFYELCDRYGLLVWQDFMFACAMYPGNKHFLNNVKQEAIDNIKRLRNHTSLALWCGNNEGLTAWENWGWKELEATNQSKEIADTIYKAYDDIFHKILPETVSELDPKRSYWPSSPGSDFGKKTKNGKRKCSFLVGLVGKEIF